MRELKLIHAADLHLDPPFGALPPEEAERRRIGRRRLLFSLAELASEKKADALLLCGDIFDSADISVDTARDFCRVVGGLDIPVLGVTGNHDPMMPGSPWARMALPENFYLFGRNEFSALTFPQLGVRFWGSGFEQGFCPPVLRDFHAPERQEGIFEVMLLHGDLGSGVSDYCPVTRREIENSGMDYVALGHIHSRSPLERAGNTFYAYPGCIEGGGYDETGEKGVLLVTLNDKGVEAQFVPMGGARYEVLRLDVSERRPVDAAMEATADLSDKDHARIIFTGECHEPPNLAAVERLLSPRLAEIQLRDETKPVRDVWERKGQDSLEGVFLSRLWTMLEQASTEDERRKIELAARYGTAVLEKGGARL